MKKIIYICDKCLEEITETPITYISEDFSEQHYHPDCDKKYEE